MLLILCLSTFYDQVQRLLNHLACSMNDEKFRLRLFSLYFVINTCNSAPTRCLACVKNILENNKGLIKITVKSCVLSKCFFFADLELDERFSGSLFFCSHGWIEDFWHVLCHHNDSHHNCCYEPQ